MLVYADADAVRPEHIVRFYQLLGGGLRDANWDGSAQSVNRLAILPYHTPSHCFASPDRATAVIPFLDAGWWSSGRGPPGPVRAATARAGRTGPSAGWPRAASPAAPAPSPAPRPAGRPGP